MDKETRNKIRNTILEIRRILEADISDQLEGIYGIARSGKAQPAAGIHTLQENPVLRYQRQQIDAALEHERDAGFSAKQAVEQFIHETAYTALNRLVAVKMLEARSLLTRTAVGDGRNSAGFKDFQMVAPQVCQSQADGGYQLFLELLFDELAASIRPLFDRRGAHSIIFPRWTVLDQVIRLLNAGELAAIWQEDETIGWVYQYFNAAEKKELKSDRPQNSRETAIFNQFYTPRYLVEFLVDNSLGRLWYDMRRGDTRLIETCRMLVRRPDETPGGRAYKDPAEIKLIDPAVGSGHFLHYAFDLLAIMYREAGYPAGDIPALILRNNLHGIDIDPRAAQLAAFTLYLRARGYEIAQGAPAQARLPTANIVVAEPMPGDRGFFEEFLSDQSIVIRNICSKVWDLLNLADEVGSLLKVELAVDEAISVERARLKKEPLFDIDKLADNVVFWRQIKDRIIRLFREYYHHALEQGDLSRLLFADEGEQGFRLLDLLREDYDIVLMNPPFTRSSIEAQKYIDRQYDHWHNSLLCAFVNRALTLVRQNGIVGTVLDRSVLIKSSYQNFREQVILLGSKLTHLVDLGWDVLDDANVEVSILVFRKGHPSSSNKQQALCVDITDYDVNHKNIILSEKVDLARAGLNDTNIYWSDPDDFIRLPNSVFGYYIPQFIRKLFRTLPSVGENLAKAVQGHAIVVDQYYRYGWEVDHELIGKGNEYILLYNGGSYSKYFLPTRQIIYWANNGYSARLHPSTVIRNEGYHLLSGIGYGKRGKYIDAHRLGYGHIFTVEGLFSLPYNDNDAWFVLGLLNSSLCQVILNTYCGQHKHVGYVNLLPAPEKNGEEQNIARFAHEGYWLKAEWYLGDETNFAFDKPWLLRAKRNNASKELRGLLNDVIERENVINRSLKYLEDNLDDAVLRLYGVKDDNDRNYVKENTKDRLPDIVWLEHRNSDVITREKYHLQALISYCVGCIFGRWDITNGGLLINKIRDMTIFDGKNIIDLRNLLFAKEKELLGGENAIVYPIKQTLSSKDVSQPQHPLKYPIKLITNGICPIDPGHAEDLTILVETSLRLLFNEEDIVQQVCQFLAVNSLNQYMTSKFFDFHLNMYQGRPIYWQLTTPSRVYSLWLYYHAIGADTLYTAVREYVSPKIKFEEDRLAELKRTFERLKTSGPAREARGAEKAVEDQESFLQELYAFRSELQRLADWGYSPDLNDGVIINIAPLQRFVPWREAEKTWEQLVQGEYDWSSMAKHIARQGQEKDRR